MKDRRSSGHTTRRRKGGVLSAATKAAAKAGLKTFSGLSLADKNRLLAHWQEQEDEQRREELREGYARQTMKQMGDDASNQARMNPANPVFAGIDGYMGTLNGMMALARSTKLPRARTMEEAVNRVDANLNGGRKTRRSKSSGGDIVSHLLTIRNQVKLYHWQTKQFARHKATDDLTAALDTNIDAFVESYMGRYGRPSVSGSIKLHNFSESAAKSFVAKETKYLETELPRKIGKSDTDLLNLRDTILGDLTKVSYLFTLA